MKRLLKRLIAARYNVFLDFNISNNAHHLESFAKAGYQIFIVHAHPPEAFIRRKILSGNMEHELTFFPKDKHLLVSMEGWRAAHYQNLKKLEKQYGIWAEVDTSQTNLDKIINYLAQQFKHEAGLAP